MSRPPNPYILPGPSTSNLLCSPDPTSSNADQSKPEPAKNEVKKYSKKDLFRLLAFMEAELQARDVALAVAKSEKAKAYLYKQPEDAECSKAMENLLSDEAMTVRNTVPKVNMEQILSVPLREYEKLTEKYVNVESQLGKRLMEIEERHEKEILQLRIKLHAAQRPKTAEESTLISTLQEHVHNLTAETSRKQAEIDQRDQELSQREEDMEKEKERAKVIILYMLHERKQLLSQLHQLRMRVKMAGPEAEEHETVLVAELKKQIVQLMDEKTHLQRVMEEQANDKAVLVNIVRGLEEEISQLKEPGHLNGQRKSIDTPPKPMPGYVVANKSAIASDMNNLKQPHSPQYNSNYTGTVVRRGSPTKYRIHNSATFPNNTMGSPTKPASNGNSRYNGIPHNTTSNLPRPSMGMAARHPPPMNNRPPVQRQSRPTMGVAVQDLQHHNSTAIPIEGGAKSMGLVQRFMRRSTSLPKRMNNNEPLGVGDQSIRASPQLPTPTTPPSPGLRKPQRVQQPPQRPQPPRPHYDNLKPGQTHIL